MHFVRTIRFSLAVLLGSCALTASHAEMVLSQVILDFQPEGAPRGDIEVFNDGPERIFVAADPFEVIGAGLPDEKRVPLAADPSTSGLLVSPRKIVLAPGERQTIRVAAVGPRPAEDRTFRLAIRPVAGPLQADQSALKVLVGYDALVLVRPLVQTDRITSERIGHTLTLKNLGNSAQEIFDGQQCDKDGGDCRALPGKRLYPGASWQQTLPLDGPVSYKRSMGPKIEDQIF